MSEVITQTDALVELNLLTYEVSDEDRDAFYVKILNSNLPMEVVTRLTTLWDVTREVGGKIIQLGKLLVVEIMRFFAKYPHFSIGLAIGAVVHTLVAAIPLVGPILAPLSLAIGGSIGFRLDTGRPTSETVEGTLINTFTDLVAMAKTFLAWFISLLRTAAGAASA